MKAWKEAIVAEIISSFDSDSVIDFPPVGKTDRAVKFSDVARSLGHDRISRPDIDDIVLRVQKLRPELRPVRCVPAPARITSADSCWNTLYLTDLELD